jgi:hypothetical protein
MDFTSEEKDSIRKYFENLKDLQEGKYIFIFYFF